MFLKKLIKTFLIFKIIIIIFVFIPAEIRGEEGLLKEDYQYILIIKFSERKLYLRDKEKEIGVYSIAVPKHNYPAISGELQRIEYNPWWYPTEKTRAAYLEKKGINLPEAVEPFIRNHLNAMGKIKFIIKFSQPTDITDAIRIHGTNDPNSIGKKITRGCVRLRNEDILALVSIIKGHKTKIIIKN